MDSLKTALGGVTKRKNDFNTNKLQVEQQVAALTNQIKVLNGGVLPQGVSEPAPAGAAAGKGKGAKR